LRDPQANRGVQRGGALLPGRGVSAVLPNISGEWVGSDDMTNTGKWRTATDAPN